MADKLTPQQHQAVYDRGGNLLVSAAAASGKTKVLVDRQTGVNYLFHASGYAGGLTPLLKPDGTPVVTPVSRYEE